MEYFRRLRRFCNRTLALTLSAALLWAVWVTAGSHTLRQAGDALCRSLPLRMLRWELGDMYRQDGLSAPAPPWQSCGPRSGRSGPAPRPGRKSW